MKKTISGTITKMETLEVQAFPIKSLNVVKVTASQLGAQLGRKYSTSLVRKNRIILVTRTA